MCKQSARKLPLEQSIVAARDGSLVGLGQLLDHYRDFLLRIANDEVTSKLACKVAPSDLVQETFLQAVRDFPKFSGGSETELCSWLRQILLNNLRDANKYWQRTEKRAGAVEVPLQGRPTSSLLQIELASQENSPSTQIRVDEDRQRVRSSLEKLPDEYRQVIELRTFDLMPFDEVGAAMSRSSEAARKLWTRAVDRLAEELLRRDQNGRSLG